MSQKKLFSKDIVIISDIEGATKDIILQLQDDVLHNLRRTGAVVGISGGIDSSLCLALAARAFGKEKVLGVIMPEKDSSPESEELALELAGKFGVKTIKEEITNSLNGFGCYKRRDEAVKRVFPEYDPATYTMKIVLRQSDLYGSLPPLFSLVIIDNGGNKKEQILPVQEYLQITAASSFKQRTRMAMLYYHSEAMHYAVIGTPNKLEYDEGFFVKYGDGGADVLPISNLYKTQVYQMAEYLGIPQNIINRTPTTDTYSAHQTQEEFFYQLPFKEMDTYWYGYENGYSPLDVAKIMGKNETQIIALFQNFDRKKKTTEYLRRAPIKNYFQG